MHKSLRSHIGSKLNPARDWVEMVAQLDAAEPWDPVKGAEPWDPVKRGSRASSAHQTAEVKNLINHFCGQLRLEKGWISTLAYGHAGLPKLAPEPK